MKKTHILFWAFLLLNFSALKAVEFQNLSTFNGLSNHRVFNGVRDTKGYLWFSTRVSIDRFDGESFYHYELPEENDNYKIRGVLLDKKGMVYAFSDKFIYRYDTDMNRFEKITVVGVGSTFIRTAFFDSTNTLWLGLNEGVLYSKDLKRWDLLQEFKKIGVFSFNEIEPGKLVLGGLNGIYKLKTENLSNYKYTFTHLLNGKRVQSIFYQKERNLLWIGTFADGLFIINPFRDSEPQKILNVKSPIRSICNVTPDQIWIGADGNGIYSFDAASGKVLKNYSQNESNRNISAINSIYDIFAYDSYVWISTYTSGIFTCNLKAVNYEHFEHQKDNSNSLHNNHVNVVLEDKDGDLWFGTNEGVSFYSTRTNEWKHLITESNDGKTSVILALSLDKDNNVWAGGYATDLFRINKKNFKISAINRIFKSIGDKKYIYSIYNDDNDVWFGGTIVGNLTKHSLKTGKTIVYNISGVIKIVEYNQDTLLIGAVDGLYVFDKKTEQSTLLKFSNKKYNNRTLSSFINSILIDELYPGIIWLGSDGGGLYKFNLYTRKMKVFSTNNGLTSKYVYGVQRDDFNRLWISTESGLNCLDVQNNKFIAGLEINDLLNKTFNYLAYCKLANGNMIWGTPNGAVLINPQKIRFNQAYPINLRFNTLNINYQNMVVGEKGSPLKQNLDETKSFSLEYAQRSFTFDFIDLNNYSHPKTLYSWKLSNFDKNWSNFSINHKAVYTNIPPGEYSFQVRASKPGSQEYETRSMDISIDPPFWRSNFAIFVYVSLIIFLIFFSMNYWNNKMEARNSDEKIRFFVNMAHDVRTPITLVKAPLNQIENENLSEDGKSALQLAQKNLDKLFNIISQLLDFQKVDSQHISLVVEDTYIKKYIENIVSNFQLLAKEKQIDLYVNLPIVDRKIYIDRKKISLCIENLLSNAIKYTNPHGKIELKLAITDDGKLQIEISDDGIGIPTKSHKKLFTRFYRAENASNSKETGSGIGLMLTNKLITLHRGKISFVSVENFGTCFKIEIPCTKEAYHLKEIAEYTESELTEIDDEFSIHDLTNILLVEDNDEIRDFLAKQLRHEYVVSEASNANEAIEIIGQNPPDFILSDIMMPGISGFELCNILKNNITTSHIPIILLSALSDRSDIIKGLQVGADDYITKPFDLSILQSKIKTIVKNRVILKNKIIDKTVDSNDSKFINPLDKAFIEKVIQQIEDNLLNENFSIDQLAVEMAKSRSVFFKKLKSITNTSPRDFIKEIRMKKAARLLLEQRYQITEIAYLVGFTNQKHFSTFFKKYYGVSPRSYIEKYTDKQNETVLLNDIKKNAKRSSV